MSNYPNLFSPIKIGPLTLKNRIEAAPMGSEPNTSGFLSEQNLAAYELRARGGAAIVTRGETLIGHRTDSAHGNLCNLKDERYMPSHLQLSGRIHQHNAIANIEILHCGARAHPRYTGGEIWGPSAEMGVYGVEVKEMDEAMMDDVAEHFANAAFVAKFGGFDMVMIHGGHGWLLSQFLSPVYNRRKDKYGGSMENRARFPLMVIERIRRRVGPDFPVEFRMSGDEFIPGGYGLDEAIDFARMLDGKVELIHVSATSFKDVNSGCRMFPSAFLPHGVNAYLAREIKKHVRTPVATVGAFSDPAHMERVIAEGEADIIAVGRQILADPWFPQKAKAGRAGEIRPCTRCNHCLSLDFVPYVAMCSGISQCTVNPVIGHEFQESLFVPRPEPRRVLVAGGGPGGMQAALSASQMGHNVILCEGSESLGGVLNSATKGIPFKADLRRFMDWLIHSVRNSSIDIRLNTKVDAELVKSIAPDVLIAAIGAEPILPPIPGIENTDYVFAADIHREGTVIGQKVAIIGGGLAGCEEGLALAMQGKEVTILEMAPELARGAPILHLKAMLMEFDKHAESLRAVTSARVENVDRNSVRYSLPDGKKYTLEADTIIVATGMKPAVKAVDSLRQANDIIFIEVGDCKKAGTVLGAVHSGYFAGKNAVQEWQP